jgi:hypothetical protein
VEEKVEGEGDGLLALPEAVGAEVGAGGKGAIFVRDGGLAGEGMAIVVVEALAAEDAFEGAAEAPFGMKKVEEAEEEGIGANGFAERDALLFVAVAEDAAHSFAFEKIGEGFHEFGFAGSEGGVVMAAADDVREGLTGGLGGAGFLAVGGEFGEVDVDPIRRGGVGGWG